MFEEFGHHKSFNSKESYNQGNGWYVFETLNTTKQENASAIIQG
jgi:hypothetical protein